MLTADIRLYFQHRSPAVAGAAGEGDACEPTLWLLATILANGAEPAAAIDAFPGDTLLTPLERPRGLPIGNLTSQFLANFHLDRFDHRLHRISGIGAYLRYVDDFALFATSREALALARGVVDQELAALRLRLHPIKSQIRTAPAGWSVSQGLARAPFFVGFRRLSSSGNFGDPPGARPLPRRQIINDDPPP